MKTVYAVILFFIAATTLYSQDTAYIELFNRGKTEMMNGNLNESLALLKQAQALSPENLYIKFYIAKATSWQNRLDEAKSLYSEIVQSSKQESEIYWMGFFGYSQVQGWQKEYDQAINNFQIIIDSEKKYNIRKGIIRDAKISKADILSWKKDYAGAIKLFDEMLSENPKDTEILNRMAKVYFWDFNLAESKKYSLMVLDTDPSNSEAMDRLKQIDDFKKYELSTGYSLDYLTAENSDGDPIKKNSYFAAIRYNINNELSVNMKIQGLTVNSVETTNVKKQSDLNTDINILLGVFYKFTTKVFSELSANYTPAAEVMPDYGIDTSLSYKLSPHIDVFMNYKFTHDELDTYEKDDTLDNHIFAPGVSLYFSNMNYLKIQPTLSTDFNDYNFLVSLTQNYGFSSYNTISGLIYYGAGKRIMEFSDSTTNQDMKSYGLSLTYSHFFSTVLGSAATISYSNFINEYESITGSLKCIYRF